MIEDPCPNCGHRRKPMLMSVTPDAPGFLRLLKGEGEPAAQAVAWLAVILFGTLFLMEMMANL